MKRRTHLFLTIAGEFLGFGAGALVAFLLQRNREEWTVSNAGLWMGACIVGGVMLPRIVFRRLIPVACEQEGCRGSAYAEGSNPIAYRCHLCDHRVETPVFESNRPGTLHEPDED